MAPSAGSNPPKLPVAPDVDQIFNRIALGMAKHQRIFDTLAKHRTPSSPSTATATATATGTTPGPGGGFSSLTNPKSNKSQLTSSSRSGNASNSATTRSPKIDDDADLNPAYALPPNAGIGYTPPSASAAAGAGGNKSLASSSADRALRTKILGRNAARQLAERDRLAAAAAGGSGSGGNRKRERGGHASDSEEEVGRAALVRTKAKAKVKVKVKGATAGNGPSEGAGAGDGDKGGKNGEVVSGPVVVVEEGRRGSQGRSRSEDKQEEEETERKRARLGSSSSPPPTPGAGSIEAAASGQGAPTDGEDGVGKGDIFEEVDGGGSKTGEVAEERVITDERKKKKKSKKNKKKSKNENGEGAMNVKAAE
ncbi:hypothetical protein N656DRAFT_775716 [Canariomyces notabilis]|uniref:Uncharacterized protein n=1 Tax=Canariomyces notabilis TaxID=2074819 RepID=A0AAN6TJR5_9PEZI|nr:hypothetical protein N656DRAFT_775716 [Canariomyces arenarius]